MAALLAAATLLFAALGGWQVERRAWKLALIDAVAARVHAPAVPAPGPAAWPGFVPAAEAYRRVSVAGTPVADRDTLVQAVTALGAGHWVLTPVRTGEGWTVLVNRGFVPTGQAAPPATASVAVSGLLRPSEPGGAFLRSNDPAADRWFSRDAAAIAVARGLGPVAPFFVDADAGATGVLPVGGLTVVAFRNEHLVYALTWFGLAALSSIGLALLATGRALRHAPA